MSVVEPTSARVSSAKDTDQPLIDDIRLLGHFLGDTIREQEGEAVLD